MAGNGYSSMAHMDFDLGVRIGKIEATLVAHGEDIMDLDSRLRKREEERWFKIELTPLQYVQIGLGIAVLLAAINKKIGWMEAIPLIGKLTVGS